MTGWGIGSSVPTVSTIQSSQTTEIVVDRKQAVLRGDFTGFVPLFGLRRTPAVFQADF
jgi:hypothetical protein